ncbi:hypothetical protein F5878DRAFT_667849 [Lentinula raphanica]|uniref:Uncharacterized protein n=1 Tax=Lentinula raphanica TaxID=153919 RepID=A0AA38U2G1_9AGAR|nr:hypothetical protein F5878DRAFT_667849 [Lentinula raphanica]
MAEIRSILGKDVYDNLDSDSKREIDVFLWTGCCMHKDQNSFKAGNSGMMKYWQKFNIEPPLLLANKANAATLRHIFDPSKPPEKPLTEQEIMALEASTRGAARLTAIAGAVFRNRDERKGQGMTYVDYFRDKLGPKFRQFPDTNNTRFASHGDAAGYLFLHTEEHIRFLEQVKLKKTKSGYTNIELNLVNGLKCVKTREEMAVLALVHQAITVPYMRVIRTADGQNALNLGPFHVEVREHVQKLIDNPGLLMTPGDDAWILGSLDGKEWEHPDVIKLIHSELSDMPNFKGLLTEFLNESLACWVRFTAEFAPGGLIDMATEEEKDSAWMPSTNDANEGALGSYRVMLRFKHSLSFLQYNAIMAYSCNNTQAFMDAMLTLDDFSYIMKEARTLDASGVEKKRREDQVAFDAKVAQMKRDKEAAMARKAVDRLGRLSKVILINRIEEIDGLTVAKLDDQLDVLRLMDADIPVKSKCGNKATRAEHLRNAFKRYLDRGRPPFDAFFASDRVSSDDNLVKDWAEADEEEDDENTCIGRS